MDAYVGSIYAFGFNFAPVGWMLCQGQTLNISDYEVLYTLIGTTYGGNGTTTFALPDLQGRVPIGTGHGAGLQTYLLGQKAGSVTTTITTSNMPAHTHVAAAATIPVGTTSDVSDPTGAYFGVSDASTGNAYETSQNVAMAANNSLTSMAGGANPPIDTISPYQVVSYCICVQGLFPPHQ